MSMMQRPRIMIGISGAPSSGKTTTAHLLRHKLSNMGFSREVVREYARHWIERYGQIKDIYQQWHIFHGQTKWEEQARKNYDLIISDSPRFLPYLYALHFLDHKDPQSTAAAIGMYELALGSLKQYDRLYLLRPPECVEQDGIRCQSDADVNDIYEASRLFLKSHCPKLLVEVPSKGKDPDAYAEFIADDLRSAGLLQRIQKEQVVATAQDAPRVPGIPDDWTTPQPFNRETGQWEKKVTIHSDPDGFEVDDERG